MNLSAGETHKLSIKYKSENGSTNGFYVRVYEYNAALPSGKLAVSNSAANTLVQEDTSGRTDWKENVSTTTSWQTTDYTYTPTSGAVWASIVVLNWTGLGTQSLYIRDPFHQLIGSSGQKGQKGQTGNTGSTGSTGSTGAKGQKGQTGNTGNTGSTGSTGQKGQKGQTGSTGGTGSAGAKGQKGEISAGIVSLALPNNTSWPSSYTNTNSNSFTLSAGTNGAMLDMQSKSQFYNNVFLGANIVVNGAGSYGMVFIKSANGATSLPLTSTAALSYGNPAGGEANFMMYLSAGANLVHTRNGNQYNKQMKYRIRTL